MTVNQEDALYNFLENVTEPFTLENITEFVRMLDSTQSGNLPREIAAHIDSHNVAFRLDPKQWVSRRGCFENVPFVICPSRLELLNGILIPGHRCIPFANPVALPHEYKFFWHGAEILWTSTEGPPEDFYPYYYIFGEEYASQYVARDNPENESAFNYDPYKDPPEVSIHTLDMRNIFRESGFIPGDRFVVRTKDWKNGYFDLEKIDKDAWTEADLFTWFEAAEGGFEDSFALIGPGASTEEQIAYAYWYGGKRMRELPAYSLEDFLFEKTDRIERIPYGIESRFWFAGKDIPDSKGFIGIALPPDKTFIENILFRANVPVSEYVILSYIRDSLFRNEPHIDKIIDRIVPHSIHLEETEWNTLADYISGALADLQEHYTLFLDQGMGMTRQRAGELHNAVVDLAARLLKGEMDPSWLPRHTFIRLSQIQGYVAILLEDLDCDESPPDSELEAMENSLESMIEAFDEQKEMIDEAMDNFRRNNLQLIRHDVNEEKKTWKTIQISISGTEVWRRVIIDTGSLLQDLHILIQNCLGWKNSYRHHFFSGGFGDDERIILDDKMRIQDIFDTGVSQMEYEYGTKWNVKLILLSPHQAGDDEMIRCIAGNGASPPEIIGGPLRFRKILDALEGGSDMEKQAALHELGPDFIPGLFDLDTCNRKMIPSGRVTT